MNPAIARGRVAHRGRDLVPLRAAVVGGDAHLRSDAHAIAFGSDKLEEQPVIRSPGDVVKDAGWLPQRRYDHVDSAIVIEVAERHAAMRSRDLEIRACRCAHVLELVAAQIAEDGVGLGIAAAGSQQADVVEHIRARDK